MKAIVGLVVSSLLCSAERMYSLIIEFIFRISSPIATPLATANKSETTAAARLPETLIISIGFFVMFGERFNIVTSIMGSILLAIAVADSIHYMSKFSDLLAENENVEEAIIDSLKHVWFACLFTSLTTIVGFLSFSFSGLRPVKILGIFTALGIAVAFLMTVIFLPSLLFILSKKERERKGKERQERKGSGL